MAAGVPIIFSGEGEGASIVADNKLGWVVPASDFDALKRAIVAISVNSNEFAKMRQNCMKCAMNKFNRPKQIKSLYHYLETNIKSGYK